MCIAMYSKFSYGLLSMVIVHSGTLHVVQICPIFIPIRQKIDVMKVRQVLPVVFVDFAYVECSCRLLSALHLQSGFCLSVASVIAQN